MSVTEAIEFATSLLPGSPLPEGQEDARWQAMLRIGEYVETDPEPVWRFVGEWGSCTEEDVRDAVACCLLEHLLEHHFDLVFPRVRKTVKENPLFRDTFSRCWKFGQSDASANARNLERLQAWCKAHKSR